MTWGQAGGRKHHDPARGLVFVHRRPRAAIANVELDANGVRLVASITVDAVRDLGLAEGSEVIAVIKASEVILATGS